MALGFVPSDFPWTDYADVNVVMETQSGSSGQDKNPNENAGVTWYPRVKMVRKKPIVRILRSFGSGKMAKTKPNVKWRKHPKPNMEWRKHPKPNVG